MASVDELLNRREEIISRVKKNIRLAQHRMVQFANNNRSDRQFSIGDYVYLKLQHYKQHSVVRRTSQKLAAKFFGPYLVIARIGEVAYKLELPLTATIHPVFHVSQLKQSISHQPVQSDLPPMPQMQELQPQAILERRMIRKKNHAITQVLIHWTGLSPADATWEIAADIARRFPNFHLEDKVGLMGEDLLHGRNESLNQ